MFKKYYYYLPVLTCITTVVPVTLQVHNLYLYYVLHIVLLGFLVVPVPVVYKVEFRI